MNHLYQLPEIAALNAPPQVLRIPNQTDVPLTPRVRRLIDTAAFGRLRNISQLGLVASVYPGAIHSRFEHSLGVYRNALLYLRQLAQFPDVVASINPGQASALIVSALLHDLGHWPYCHPIEDLRLPGWPEHESLIQQILETPEIRTLLHEDWGLVPADICNLLNKRTNNAGDKICCNILSGPIDVDKLDYLYRDSLHAGVPYGLQFDTGRIISSLCLNETNDGLAITDKGRTAAELMVFARYIMFSEVYWHPAVRAATAMLQRAFYCVRDKINPVELLPLSDEQFRMKLLQLSQGTPVEDLTQDLFGPRRQLFKRVAQFSLVENPDLFSKIARRPYPELVGISQRMARILSLNFRQNIPAEAILIDAPPVGLEVQFRVSVRVGRTEKFRPLGELSPVVQALATQQFDDYVKRVRVFVHPRWQEKIETLAIEPLLFEAASPSNHHE